MTSVRARILIPVLMLLLLGDLTISLLALRDSHHEIEEVYDAQLAQSARLLQGVLRQRAAGEQDLDKLYQAFDQAMSRVGTSGVAHPYETRLTFQVWRTSGELLVRSAEAPLLSAPPATEGSHDLVENGHEWCGFLLADPQQGFLIWVGERDDVRQDLIQRIVSHTLWPTLIGVPLLVVAIWLAIGWGLRPLQAMARVIRKRDAESLEPLDVTPLPKELEPMQYALNRLLTQIESVLERERRFIADAAHELRTPLTILRIHAQNARQAETPEQRLEALDFLVHGVDRAARLASQLLTMARLEPRLEVSQLQTFELNTLVREEMAELTPLALENARRSGVRGRRGLRDPQRPGSHHHCPAEPADQCAEFRPDRQRDSRRPAHPGRWQRAPVSRRRRAGYRRTTEGAPVRTLLQSGSQQWRRTGAGDRRHDRTQTGKQSAPAQLGAGRTVCRAAHQEQDELNPARLKAPRAGIARRDTG